MWIWSGQTSCTWEWEWERGVIAVSVLQWLSYSHQHTKQVRKCWINTFAWRALLNTLSQPVFWLKTYHLPLKESCSKGCSEDVFETPCLIPLSSHLHFIIRLISMLVSPSNLILLQASLSLALSALVFSVPQARGLYALAPIYHSGRQIHDWDGCLLKDEALFVFKEARMLLRVGGCRKKDGLESRKCYF